MIGNGQKGWLTILDKLSTTPCDELNLNPTLAAHVQTRFDHLAMKSPWQSAWSWIPTSWKWQSYPETKITPENWLVGRPPAFWDAILSGANWRVLPGGYSTFNGWKPPQKGIRSGCHWQGGKKNRQRGHNKSMREKWRSHVPASPWLNWRVQLDPLISGPNFGTPVTFCWESVCLNGFEKDNPGLSGLVLRDAGKGGEFWLWKW